MNDKAIIRIIPKIHFKLVAFFLFFLFTGFFTFIALSEGVEIERLKLGSVRFEQLYLKWDHKLIIQAQVLDLNDLYSPDTALTLDPLSKIPTALRFTERWIESIDIKTILYRRVHASLFYRENSQGSIRINSDNIRCQGTFDLNKSRFLLVASGCASRYAVFSGMVTVDLPQEKIHSLFDARFPDISPIRVEANGFDNQLYFSVTAREPLSSVKPLVEALNIKADVMPWITEYGEGNGIILHSLRGKVDYNDPQSLLRNLSMHATYRGLNYRFSEGIEPIKSDYTDINFKNGKLVIRPVDGTFYAQPTEKSYLDIDFNPPTPVLNAYIQTHAQLNDDILFLLSHYGIAVPIKQTKGNCSVDLNLSINLDNFKVRAKGVFSPSPSELLLDSIPVRSEGGSVYLDDSLITFKGFTAHYKSMVHARVEGNFNAENENGLVNIKAYDIDPAGNRNLISLLNPRQPLEVEYQINPDRDTLRVSPSQWKVHGETLNVDGFTSPFDYHKAAASVESVSVSIKNKMEGKLSAVFDGSKKLTQINLNLNRFFWNTVELKSAPFSLKLRYADDKATVYATKPSTWAVNQMPISFSEFNATVTKDSIFLSKATAKIADVVDTELSARYDLTSQRGTVFVDSIHTQNQKIEPLVEINKQFEIQMDASQEELMFRAEEMGLSFTTIPIGWQVSISDISLLSKHSPLLRYYNIENGYMNLYYTGETSRYTFSGEINYPYSLLVLNDQSISKYRFTGAYRNGQSTFRINDRVMINYGNEIAIRANNIGINAPQMAKFLSDHQKNTSDIKSSAAALALKIHATNTYLYLMKGRKILADTLDAQSHGNTMNATLQHLQGNANLTMREGLFYIEGDRFGDMFMDHLFSFGDFDGGNLSFKAKGNENALEGIMKIDNTVLKEYRLFNNVLAFINTIPSLTTFSLPSYNSLGLPVKDGYAHFTYNKGIVTVDNVMINSPEIKIYGEGKGNLPNDTVAGTITLKSDLGSTLGKIPLVGYILLGDDGSISTTVTVGGKLSDPTVDTAIAKEIVTAPFNILKRTLISPFLWMMDDKK